MIFFFLLLSWISLGLITDLIQRCIVVKEPQDLGWWIIGIFLGPFGLTVSIGMIMFGGIAHLSIFKIKF